MLQLGTISKIPQLTPKQPFPWIKIDTLVSKSSVNIYLSLQHAGAKGGNHSLQHAGLKD